MQSDEHSAVNTFDTSILHNKDENKLTKYALISLAVALALFSVAANIAGGYALYEVTGNVALSTGVSIIGALAVAVVSVAYVIRKTLTKFTFVLHIVCAGLMTFAAMHFGEGMQLKADTAKADLAEAENNISNAKARIEELKKELESLNTPIDGMNETEIAERIKSLKLAKVKGLKNASLWSVSAQCTIKKYQPDCDIIASWERKLAIEKDRASGVRQRQIKAEIGGEEAKIGEWQPLPKALNEKISKNSILTGFGANTKAVLLAISMAFSAIFESMLGFVLHLTVMGVDAKKQLFTLPKRSPNISPNALPKFSGVGRFISGMFLARHKLEAKKAALQESVAKQQAVAKLAESQAIREKARYEFEGKKLEMEILSSEASVKISSYLKSIPEMQLKKLMAGTGLMYHTKTGQKLFANIKRALSFYDAGQVVTKRGMAEAIVSAFNLPTIETHGKWTPVNVGDVSPYVNDDYVIDKLIPALVKLQLLQSTGGKRSRYSWVSVIDARKAVGADVILEGIAEDKTPVVKPFLKVVK